MDLIVLTDKNSLDKCRVLGWEGSNSVFKNLAVIYFFYWLFKYIKYK